MIKLSTQTRTDLASTAGLKDIFETGFIGLYSGSQPSSPDNAEAGTLLATVSTTSGTAGLGFGTAGTGVLPKASSVWSGVVGTAGVAGWFRLYDTNHTTGSNGTARRIDGSIGVSGTDMILANTSLVVGATVTIDTFSLEVPQA